MGGANDREGRRSGPFLFQHDWVKQDEPGLSKCSKCGMLREWRQTRENGYRAYFKRPGQRQATPLPRTRKVPKCSEPPVKVPGRSKLLKRLIEEGKWTPPS